MSSPGETKRRMMNNKWVFKFRVFWLRVTDPDAHGLYVKFA